jgi:hypothetical protein
MREFECSDGVNDRLALFDTLQQARLAVRAADKSYGALTALVRPQA